MKKLGCGDGGKQRELDLTPRVAPNLDRHLVFPILEFLQERQQILKFKIELLNKTNMVDYAMDIHKSLYHTEDAPQEFCIAVKPGAEQDLVDALGCLYIFFNHDNGRTQIIDLFIQDKYLNAIQTTAPHLLRYLATAFIVNRRRRPQLKEFINVIQQEHYSYKDPIVEFLACVFVNYDFDGAQRKMIYRVIVNDPFLGKRVESGNFSTGPLRDEFLENACLLIVETYCRIHQRIDMGVLAEKLNLDYEEAERWIVNLICTSKLDAKIDSDQEPHEQLINHTKALSGRTFKLVTQLLEHTRG
ncbi:hypothetical protein Bca52824_007613 [Brassica carinata]|uniref:PCI domain-containing protein n=1 Tax=Brassica carinata TaxID=52824 RepID=A0A8X7W9M8_BRACI|nr:hypothetical protein Bca52824_007613 [Brassica carinata]